VEKIQVNIVSDEKPDILAREAPSSERFSISYSTEPHKAKTNVFFGVMSKIPDEAVRRQSILFVAEPPEIHRYSREMLSSFRWVLAPEYRYLRGLPNFVPIAGCVPWRIGIEHETGNPKLTLTRNDIASLEPPTQHVLTAVVSEKSKTPLQKRRISFVELLSRELPNFELFGRERRPVADKVDAHLMGRFHFASENSSHRACFSEKLTDALLVGNHVFYSGHPSALRFFDPRSITMLDLRFPTLALRKIRSVMARSQTEEDARAALDNRARVLNEFNFQTQLINFLSRQPTIPMLRT
jgi:hypothetical protein